MREVRWRRMYLCQIDERGQMEEVPTSGRLDGGDLSGRGKSDGGGRHLSQADEKGRKEEVCQEEERNQVKEEQYGR
jgi:hypothetical protein